MVILGVWVFLMSEVPLCDASKSTTTTCKVDSIKLTITCKVDSIKMTTTCTMDSVSGVPHS